MKIYGTDRYPDILEINQLAQTFTRGGFEIYMVGGSVRDMVLGKSVKDYDFATNATPRQVQKLFRRVIPTGIDHGTVTVLLGAYQFEVTTYRVDGDYSDSRHPDTVTYAGKLSEDLKRRDFTINAMAIDPLDGTLVDLYCGMEDLSKGVLRAIGDPVVRFKEDPLRILRGCRFAGQLEFSIEEKTLDAMSKESIALISKERIKDELEKTLKTDNPARGLSYMVECGVLQNIFPEFSLFSGESGFMDITFSLINRVGTSLEYGWLERCTALYILCLSEQYMESGAIEFERVRTMMNRLKCSKKERRFVEHLYQSYYATVRVLKSDWADADLRGLFVRVQGEFWVSTISLLGVLLPDSYEEQLLIVQRLAELVLEGFPLSIQELAVDAKTLMDELGRPAGPWLGDTLEMLFAATLKDPNINTPETLIALAKEVTQSID